MLTRESVQSNNLSSKIAFSPSRYTSPSIDNLIKKQIQDLRDRINNYKVLAHLRESGAGISSRDLPDHADIIIFGPTGSGKSSLIRTFYRALHNTKELGDDIQEKLSIKQKDENEGTTEFTAVVIKKQTKIDEEYKKNQIRITTGNQTINDDEFEEQYRKIRNKGKRSKDTELSSKIIAHDTRGQIWMDEREMRQLHILIKGKVKDKTKVEQRNYRYAYLLWEFWKRDQDLFPNTILQKGKSIKRKPHSLIFVFDGSMDEIPNGEEETKFYKDIIQMARRRKYVYPQIVLTCVDKIEDKLVEEEELKTGQQLDFFEKEQKLREIMDYKEEKVVLNLGIQRSSVHFIENYKTKDEEQKIRIDYKALRLLHECVQQSDSYIQSNIQEKNKCLIF
ncbi:UNKNOWN [Stylonychia lemnae]|uniref:Uncharacterized protein n=1 Tax=Stylonychia lemnae TaxID=5949 RepID=A0A078B393_STYLE|nr:UNKNOWN [Stylonychia lemnae]|eukprot:CDW88736.1 UNKNOWN [Stylonychia lemnae]